MIFSAGDKALYNGVEVTVKSYGAGKAEVVLSALAPPFYIPSQKLKPVKVTKAVHISKYPWSEALLEKFKQTLLSHIKPDVETPRSTILVNMGVWTPEDAENYAKYDNQLRLLREAMYWLCDNGTLVATSSNGLMLPQSEQAKERCRQSVEQRKSKSKLGGHNGDVVSN